MLTAWPRGSRADKRSGLLERMRRIWRFFERAPLIYTTIVSFTLATVVSLFVIGYMGPGALIAAGILSIAVTGLVAGTRRRRQPAALQETALRRARTACRQARLDSVRTRHRQEHSGCSLANRITHGV